MPKGRQNMTNSRNRAIRGHITRKLLADEPLNRTQLEHALEVCPPDVPEHNLYHATHLEKGEPLSDYEKSMVVDIWLAQAHLWEGDGA